MIIPPDLISNVTQGVTNSIAFSYHALASSNLSECNTLGQSRTVLDIIWSCLSTIFICIWVSVHPNVPQPGWNLARQFCERLILALLALLAPEAIFVWAFRQWLVARLIAEECRDAAEKYQAVHQQGGTGVNGAGTPSDTTSDATSDTTSETSTDTTTLAVAEYQGRQQRGLGVGNAVSSISKEYHETRAKAVADAIEKVTVELSSKNSIEAADEREDAAKARAEARQKVSSENTVAYVETDQNKPKWTTTHGFFITMGGFHTFNNCNEPGITLTPLHVVELVRQGLIIPPTEQEINDRSKSDPFSKSLALVQTLWFAMQCIARHIEHLPITQLEIATLAYIIPIVGIYICWWNKPLGVAEPVQVQTDDFGGYDDECLNQLGYVICAFTGENDGTDKKLRRVPRLSAGQASLAQICTADVTASMITIVFGAIHCFAWSYHFPSEAEQGVWRITSAVTASLPVVWIILCLITMTGFLELSDSAEEVATLFTGTVTVISFLIYIVACIMILVLAVIGLRSLPPDAYQTVRWTAFIPHV